jgi:membrane-associated protease RseP (regulator of RpoE activity)
MKIRTRTISTLLLAASLLTTTAIFAQQPREPREPRRVETFIIRNGEVVDVNGERLVLGGKRAFLGVGLVDITPQLREHYGASKESGALVGSVEAGSPADKAGLRVGDIITAVDGKEIDSAMDLRRALRDKKNGDSARIDVQRGRNRSTVVATLTEKEVTVPPGLRELDIDALRRSTRDLGAPPEWRTHVTTLPNCAELQTRIKDLEGRLKDLEKKLQK